MILILSEFCFTMDGQLNVVNKIKQRDLDLDVKCVVDEILIKK